MANNIIKGTNKKLKPWSAEILLEPASNNTVTNRTSSITHNIFL